VCGLKLRWAADKGINKEVTPHVGVWIETLTIYGSKKISLVTPHVGVWIETLIQTISVQPILVTPHVGVWIETQMGSG
jgi:hypothetical protein